jgi:hypothetical protein
MIRILEAQKLMDPVDPDPEHWCKNRRIFSVNFVFLRDPD